MVRGRALVIRWGMTDRLPLRKALDEYKITPETLWVSFYVFAPFGTNRPERELRHGFSLSYPGREGASALLQANAPVVQEGSYLGCFSLSGLEQLLAHLRLRLAQSTRPLSSSVASFLRIKKDFVVVVKKGGEEFVESASAFTLEGAMARARQEHPEAIISFGGELDDLTELIEKMRNVQSTQDFSSVSFDRRSDIAGWPSPTLLMGKKNPDFVPAMERFEEGDG